MISVDLAALWSQKLVFRGCTPGIELECSAVRPWKSGESVEGCDPRCKRLVRNHPGLAISVLTSQNSISVLYLIPDMLLC